MLCIKGLNCCQTTEEVKGTYCIEVEAVDHGVGTLCEDCGSSNIIRFGKRDRHFRDLPMHGKKVEIVYRLQRWRCQDCGSVVIEEAINQMDSKRSVTVRLVEWVVQHVPTRTFTSIATELGMHEKTVRNIFNDFHDQRKELPVVAAPRVLGIDEVHLIHDMRCVIINVETAQFYDILKTRSQNAVTDFLVRMPDRKNVEVICMDMHRPYLRAAHSALKQAVPVIDKFHVLKYATLAMEEVRKHTRLLHKDMRKNLKRERFVLLKRAHRLNPFQKMNVEVWSSIFPELGAAYRAKEAFFKVYDAADRADAEDRYCEWLAKLPPHLEKPFLPLTTAVGNWHKEIFNYFDHRYTNATTEALNGIIKVANRTGRGYTFDTLRKKILARDYPSLTTLRDDLEQGVFLD
jgi:transposase